MSTWVLKGLRTGIKSTRYPDTAETTAGISPGRPGTTPIAQAEAATRLAAVCPTDALAAEHGGVTVDYTRCVHCLRCARAGDDTGIAWQEGYEWAAEAGDPDSIARRLGKAFGRSLHIRYLDAGACGACMSEARQLNNPYYNIHRLGFFMTPTPRNADIMLVAGPVTDAMILPLKKTYEAMPEPKRVVAIGVCALSGGVFGRTFASQGGVHSIIPVDVMVPGCPPPPLAILHGLLVAVQRKPPVALASPAPQHAPAAS
jgi:Ni,Fe-hydrogenase III small subunit/ferredoxin-like protein FixX